MRLVMAGMSPAHLHECGSHAHAQWEIVVVLSGCGELTVGSVKIPYTPGTIVCQPPNIPHSAVGLPDFQDMSFQIEDFSLPVSDEVPVFSDDSEKRYTTLGRMLYEVFHRNEPNAQNLTSALLDAMYQLMVGWGMQKIVHPAVGALVREMIFNIPNSDFSIAEHIRNSGYCTDHFRRCFKHETGYTPTAYMLTLRIDHARRILELHDRGGYTIQQIAHMSGFSDAYYFSTAFRKILGCSPSQYAKQIADAHRINIKNA